MPRWVSKSRSAYFGTANPRIRGLRVGSNVKLDFIELCHLGRRLKASDYCDCERGTRKQSKRATSTRLVVEGSKITIISEGKKPSAANSMGFLVERFKERYLHFSIGMSTVLPPRPHHPRTRLRLRQWRPGIADTRQLDPACSTRLR